MGDNKEFPMKCSECGGFVWRSQAVILDSNTYCEECAGKEPEQGNDDG